MIDPDVSSVSSFLKNKNILIHPTNKWLQDCVSCFKTNTPSFSLQSLKEFVFGQWLLADLSDISSPMFPEECKKVQKYLLAEKYAVQINYAVNVAEAFHKQLQKIRRPEVEANLSVDVEKEKNPSIPANRMYKFEITDGVNVMKGFEDKLMTNLPETIVPGVKAILNGPIECRKGILFLKSTSVQLLGGEVDTLLIPNCTENILARTLGLPENPNPYKLALGSSENEYPDLMDEDKDLLLQVAEEMDYPVKKENDVINSNVPQNNLNKNDSTDSVIWIDDDDDFAVAAAENVLIAEEKNFRSNISNESNSNKCADSGGQKKIKERSKNMKLELHSKQVRIDSFIKKNEKETVKSYKSLNKSSSFKDLRNALRESYSSSHVNTEETTSESGTDWFPPPHKFNLEIPRSHSEEGKIVVDITKEFPLESVQNSQSEELKAPRVNCHSSSVKDDVFPPKNFPCTKVVLGKVVKLSEKLSLSNDRWNLSVILSVRGDEIEVDFSSETLDKLFGITATQLQAQRNEVKQNPAIKDKINKLLKSSQQRIRQLHSKMKIHFSNHISKPIIIDIIE